LPKDISNSVTIVVRLSVEPATSQLRGSTLWPLDRAGCFSTTS